MAIRTFEDIERLKAQEQADNAESSVQSLPPGFIVGFEISISSDYACTIGSGVANVAGERVDLAETALSDSVWQVNRAGGGSGIWYYIYVDRHGVLRVEMVEPEWNSTYYYMGFPGAHFRAIAKIFVNEDDNIMLGSEDLNKEFEDVTVSANDYSGGMFQCDGTADEVQLNLAIRYANSQGINKVTLIGGSFTLGDSITLLSDIHLEISKCTIVAPSDGTKAIDIEDVNDIIVANGIMTTASTGTTFVSISDSDRVTIAGINTTGGWFGMSISALTAGADILVSDCQINDTVDDGMQVVGTFLKSVRIQNSRFEGCAAHGIDLGSSVDVYIIDNVFKDTRESAIEDAGDRTIIQGNRITNCGQYYPTTQLMYGIAIESGSDQALVTGNHVKDSGSVIAYGDCEHATNFPQTDGVSNSNATASRSDAITAYEGDYCLKINKDNAAGTSAYYRWQDNITTTDMHEFVAGATYTHGMWVYVPSSGGPAVGEVNISIADYYDGAWETTTSNPTGTDAWEWVEVERTIRAGATGVAVQVWFTSTAAVDEYVYVDDVRIYEPDLANYSGCKFSDLGTGTEVHGNSWQTWNMTGEEMGDLYMIPMSDRPGGWVLSAGNSTATTPWAEVDFSEYVPQGVKALVLRYYFSFTGTGSLDSVAAYLRPNGSSATDTEQVGYISHAFNNMASGNGLGHGSQIIVECDTDGIIEYYLSNSAGGLSLGIQGYYM